MKTLCERAISRNRRRWQLRQTMNKLRMKMFDYEDDGKLEKAERVLSKLVLKHKELCQ